MRMVFVNVTHPDTPHVSGMRLGRFADAMARRGHAVILLTGTLPGCEVALDEVRAKITDLESETWESPLVLPVQPKVYWPIRAVRDRKVPPIFRRMLTAWSFIRHGGVFPDWTMAAAPIASQMAQEFKPDIVWATFGNTSNLSLAALVARKAGCPWVMDIKDNWEAYVPAGLRRFMAIRFRSAAGMTYNSENQRRVAQAWLGTEKEALVYSGVSEDFFERHGTARVESGRYSILLAGSVRYRDRLIEFLDALQKWLEALPEDLRKLIQFRYAGSDSALVSEVLASHRLPCDVEIDEQMPIARFAELCRESWLVSYLWAPYTFHHKLMELLVAARVVLAYPGEHEESVQLAGSVATPLDICSDEDELLQCFSKRWAQRDQESNEQPSPGWRWDDFAGSLEEFFLAVTDDCKRVNQRC